MGKSDWSWITLLTFGYLRGAFEVPFAICSKSDLNCQFISKVFDRLWIKNKVNNSKRAQKDA